MADSDCTIYVYSSIWKLCKGQGKYGGTCNSGGSYYGSYLTYTAADDNRKVVVSDTTAGTFNVIFLVTAKGGVTKEKTVAVKMKSCATESITLVEPSASAYTAALSTAIFHDTGDKDYVLPVWTTSDPTNCPILSYKLKSTSSSEISYLLCDGWPSN